jgi:uncharacterized protein YdiU (UPF0061 family)
MSVSTRPALHLEGRFARDLPEMAVPWEAERFPDARLLVLNDALASELGLDPEFLRTDAGAALLVGNALPDGATPVAQAYAGHQFGAFSPRLGDGRALLLGELRTPDGRLRDVHLKGSGPTPFARGGDGFAALGPMLREYVVSEAMHALGIPTTRSLAVVATGRPVRRETLLPGAVLTRVATSHLRVGSFQYARATGDEALLRRLADHAIARHHPAAATADRPYLALLAGVTAAQASLVAQWMLVGFVHGVMNTDNMTISGETIDYGPCAFMDAFDPATVFSSIDAGGRYAFGNQPGIALWNLARLADTLLPLIHPEQERAIELAQECLAAFGLQFQDAWRTGMRAKLGLSAEVDDETVSSMSGEFLGLLQETRSDYTSSFRALGAIARGESLGLSASPGDADPFAEWVPRWRALAPDAAALARANPVYIPRNHAVESALAAAGVGDLAPLQELLEAVTAPYTERPGFERYAEPGGEAFGGYRTFCGT